MANGDILYPSKARYQFNLSPNHFLTKFAAITIARIYHNRSNTAHYKRMFDELQRLAIEVAGTPIAFKLFSPLGNLIVMLADMEFAAILGAAKSFLSTLDRAYSGLQVTNHEELIAYFVRLCLTHGKR